MNQSSLPPLAQNYLDELAHLLSDIDVVERLEVLDGVREHLEASLERTSRTDAEIRAALLEIGSPQAVAEAAYADRPSQATAGPRIPRSSRAWYPLIVLGLEILALLTVISVAGSSAGVMETSVSEGGSGQPDVVTVTESTFNGSVAAGFSALLVSLPFLFVLMVMVGVSALWSQRQKLSLVALAPALAVAYGILPEIGYAVLGTNGVYLGAWIALALTVFGGGILLSRLIGAALRRAETLKAPVGVGQSAP